MRFETIPQGLLDIVNRVQPIDAVMTFDKYTSANKDVIKQRLNSDAVDYEINGRIETITPRVYKLFQFGYIRALFPSVPVGDVLKWLNGLKD